MNWVEFAILNEMGFFNLLKSEVISFGSNSSIQGLSYVCNREKHVLLRCIWLIIVVVLFVLSGISIKESFDGKSSLSV